MSAKKLKFGIICNSQNLQQWQATAINYLLQDPHFELCLVVVNNNQVSKESYLKKIFSSTLLFRQYETRVLKVAAKQAVTMSSLFEGIETIKVKTNNKGKYNQYFEDTDTNLVKEKKLDFLIRFGFGILKGDILNAAKYGIWSYHHGDENEFRGGPPGFWEIFRGMPTTACMLQRLTPTLDGGTILKKGVFETTNHSYNYHLNTLFTHTAIWIKQVGLDILYNTKNIDTPQPSKQKLPINKAPTNITFLVFLLILLKNKLLFWFDSLFKIELWAIGVLKNTKDDIFNAEPLSANWVKDNTKLSYRADPFVTTINNKQTIFFERYNYSTNKGHIAALKLDSKGEEVEVLNTKTHYSYPFIFKDKDQVFCLPEGYINNNAILHSITSNLQLTTQKILLENIEVVDPSLLFYNNKYWLFCTVNNKQHNAQLFIFYSDNLEGAFTPHLLNPVKTDISSARPAGSFFEFKGDIIRPSQNCSETYGGSLMLNKITTLSETDYNETLIKEISPFDKHFNKGLHHISIDNNTIVIDSKRYIYSISKVLRKFFG